MGRHYGQGAARHVEIRSFEQANREVMHRLNRGQLHCAIASSPDYQLHRGTSFARKRNLHQAHVHKVGFLYRLPTDPDISLTVRGSNNRLCLRQHHGYRL